MFFFMALPLHDFQAKDTRSAPGALRHNPHISSRRLENRYGRRLGSRADGDGPAATPHTMGFIVGLETGLLAGIFG